jgi:hypothetical protein
MRKLLWTMAALLLGVNLYLAGWHRGFDSGYSMGMSDVYLGIKSAEDFFKEKLEQNKREYEKRRRNN